MGAAGDLFDSLMTGLNQSVQNWNAMLGQKKDPRVLNELEKRIDDVREKMKSFQPEVNLTPKEVEKFVDLDNILHNAVKVLGDAQKAVFIIDRGSWVPKFLKKIWANLFWGGNWAEVDHPISDSLKVSEEVHNKCVPVFAKFLGKPKENVTITYASQLGDMTYKVGKGEKEKNIKELFELAVQKPETPTLILSTPLEANNYLNSMSKPKDEIDKMTQLIDKYKFTQKFYFIEKEEPTVVAALWKSTTYYLRVGDQKKKINYEEYSKCFSIEGEQHKYENLEKLAAQRNWGYGPDLYSRILDSQQIGKPIVETFAQAMGLRNNLDLPPKGKWTCELTGDEKLGYNLLVRPGLKGERSTLFTIDCFSSPGKIFLMAEGEKLLSPDMGIENFKKLLSDIINAKKPENVLLTDKEVQKATSEVNEDQRIAAEKRATAVGQKQAFAPKPPTEEDFQSKVKQLGPLAEGAYTFVESSPEKFLIIFQKGGGKRVEVTIEDGQFKFQGTVYPTLEDLFTKGLGLPQDKRISPGELNGMVKKQETLISQIENHLHYSPTQEDQALAQHLHQLTGIMPWYTAREKVVPSGESKFGKWDFRVKLAGKDVITLNLVREKGTLIIRAIPDQHDCEDFSALLEFLKSKNLTKETSLDVVEDQYLAMERKLQEQTGKFFTNTTYNTLSDAQPLADELFKLAEKKNVSVGGVVFILAEKAYYWLLAEKGQKEIVPIRIEFPKLKEFQIGSYWKGTDLDDFFKIRLAVTPAGAHRELLSIEEARRVPSIFVPEEGEEKPPKVAAQLPPQPALAPEAVAKPATEQPKAPAAKPLEPEVAAPSPQPLPAPQAVAKPAAELPKGLAEEIPVRPEWLDVAYTAGSAGDNFAELARDFSTLKKTGWPFSLVVGLSVTPQGVKGTQAKPENKANFTENRKKILENIKHLPIEEQFWLYELASQKATFSDNNKRNAVKKELQTLLNESLRKPENRERLSNYFTKNAKSYPEGSVLRTSFGM